MRSYFIAIIVLSFCASGLCQPTLGTRFHLVGNIASGVTMVMRGSPAEVDAAIRLSTTLLASRQVGPGRLYVPSVYVPVVVGPYVFEVVLGTLMFKHVISREFTQFEVINRADELLRALSVELSAAGVADKQ